MGALKGQLSMHIPPWRETAELESAVQEGLLIVMERDAAVESRAGGREGGKTC